MRREVASAAVAAAFLAVACAAIGYDWLGDVLHIVSNWLLDLPAPTETWADIIKSLAWPTTLLTIVSAFRRPLRTAAFYLARRFKTDHIKAGIFQINAATELIPLNEADRDHKRIEALWEFVGASDENWNHLLSWIAQKIATGIEIEDFLAEGMFAPERELAYAQLVKG